MTVGFQSDGKTLAWSQKNYSREYPVFQLPCSKCIECRLEYARTWAIRCVHEAKMHQNNSFITLTYSDEHLISDKLIYSDFQSFIKRLRSEIWERNKHCEPDEYRISTFVTGEYGDQKKRPHWHALIFNWRPNDLIYHYTNDRGDRVFTSPTLTRLWGKGHADIGSVTFESAGYVARYAAKKLVHGHDGHDYEPISRKSNKHAIGKRFLEKYWQDIFNVGKVILYDGTEMAIPRYYEKWLQKNQPDAWEHYIKRIKLQRSAEAAEKEKLKIENFKKELDRRHDLGKSAPMTQKQINRILIEEKFAKLQQHLKGDI